jgi:hypothetical protein
MADFVIKNSSQWVVSEQLAPAHSGHSWTPGVPRASGSPAPTSELGQLFGSLTPSVFAAFFLVLVPFALRFDAVVATAGSNFVHHQQRLNLESFCSCISANRSQSSCSNQPKPHCSVIGFLRCDRGRFIPPLSLLAPMFTLRLELMGAFHWVQPLVPFHAAPTTHVG